MFTTRDSKGHSGGHPSVLDGQDDYEYDPDFEFDAPQWIDIASDHPDVERSEYDAWFDIPHPSHEDPQGREPLVPLITPPRIVPTNSTRGSRQQDLPVHTSGQSVPRNTFSGGRAPRPKTPKPNSHAKVTPYVQQVVQKVPSKHFGSGSQVSRSNSRTIPGTPGSSHLPVVDDESDESDETGDQTLDGDSLIDEDDELALLAARHNVAIGAAQDMDELLVALAEHNRNVAHLPEVDDDEDDIDECDAHQPTHSTEPLEDDDIMQVLRQHNSRILQNDSAVEQRGGSVPVTAPVQHMSRNQPLHTHAFSSQSQSRHVPDRRRFNVDEIERTVAEHNSRFATGAKPCPAHPHIQASRRHDADEEDELAQMLLEHNIRVRGEKDAKVATLVAQRKAPSAPSIYPADPQSMGSRSTQQLASQPRVRSTVRTHATAQRHAPTSTTAARHPVQTYGRSSPTSGTVTTTTATAGRPRQTAVARSPGRRTAPSVAGHSTTSRYTGIGHVAVESTLDAQLARKLQRHASKSGPAHAPPRQTHKIWTGNENADVPERPSKPNGLARRTVLGDASNVVRGAVATKPKTTSADDEIAALINMHNVRFKR